MDSFDVIVIGQGYAGLCAARLACEQGLSVATFEREMAGGVVMTVLGLDPSPESFTSSGPDLGAVIAMQNMDLGAKPFFDAATGLLPRPGGGWDVISPHGVYAARHVVMATGAKPRKLGIPGEREHEGKGVSHCADCDGPRVAGHECIVVGSGDAAFQEAAILARFARAVTIVMRGGAPKARPDLVEKALAGGRTRILAGTRVTAILGNGLQVTGARLEGGEGVRELCCKGVFVFIGSVPDSGLLPALVARDGQGGLLVDADGATGLPGLWAVGAVRSGFPGGLSQAGADASRAIAALRRGG
ncbi:NAD(P)/FAD-dependent oxidoreductase [Paracoccus sp. MA]|uniref:NAD(P)/FAD-dependent oxidoreductase n=1 Tax=Paracoccus sp. MA TaxID=2895796 RepID=UPI001E5EA5F6|nr:NAD(P)/FAD-dependent oxidoreductase [Paracoccus sp. MA]UFM64065.1 NAD(P)/FAD-dependent oxidoreductase [Paracoccus sp. MA]